MDVLSYVLASDGARVAAVLAGWVSGIVCFSQLARVISK